MNQIYNSVSMNSKKTLIKASFVRVICDNESRTKTNKRLILTMFKSAVTIELEIKSILLDDEQITFQLSRFLLKSLHYSVQQWSERIISASIKGIDGNFKCSFVYKYNGFN